MDVSAIQDQHPPTASPVEISQRSFWPTDTNGRPSASSSSSTSSYIMPDEPTTKAFTLSSVPACIQPPASINHGPIRSSRVSKPRSKPIGGSVRPSRHNSDHGQYSQSQSDEQRRSLSSASSSSLQPIEETLRRSRAGPARSSSGMAGGLLTTGHGGNHNVTLRTASRKPKTGPTAGKAGAAVPKTESPNLDLSNGLSPSSPDGSSQTDSLTLEERRARQNHNIVEKQYRNRLNSQFDRLLQILPANQPDGPDGARPMEIDEKRMSKAEVLELARKRIYQLEKEIQDLYTESESLRNNVQTLNMAIQSGRQIQPATI
ncbi:hypothetical protein SBRCBS47491_002685 [Sporothrix bragantina]|uniref:BHLH domain-containing protein n=1 Tax=Sporothrix bragantina TaxID=671064 RepID=A0ABP0B8W7_9PEZI